MKAKLILDLGSNYHNDEDVIDNLIDYYTKIASYTSHRPTTDEKLEPYIYTAVKEAYIRRGDEGSSSSNVGGLSASYIDIEKKLKEDIISIRIGNF
jgi:hypothetical protein